MIDYHRASRQWLEIARRRNQEWTEERVAGVASALREARYWSRLSWRLRKFQPQAAPLPPPKILTEWESR